MTRLVLPPRKRLHLLGCYISQYYNRLRRYEAEERFRGLFPLLYPDGGAFRSTPGPTNLTGPHQKSRVGAPLVTRAADPELRGGIGTQLHYIDDINAIGTSRSGVNKVTERMVETQKQYHLPIEPAKLQFAAHKEPSLALGLWWWPEGIVTVRPAMARRLFSQTTALLKKGWVRPKELRRLLGCWTWACLLRRGLLSVLNEVYETSTIINSTAPRVLSLAQRTELEMLLDLFPLIFDDL